jgi:hypothetical protein
MGVPLTLSHTPSGAHGSTINSLGAWLRAAGAGSVAGTLQKAYGLWFTSPLDRAGARGAAIGRARAHTAAAEGQYIPPPGGIPPPIRPSSFSAGISQMTASVLRRSEAMEAAFCRAQRTTLVGSMMPASTRFS